jgi:hypothetical protein
MAHFLQPECAEAQSSGAPMEGKWAFLYLIVVVVLTLSYSTDLRIIKLPSLALPVMHLRTIAD